MVSAATQRERDSDREQFTWGRFQGPQQTDEDAKRGWWLHDRL
jgi:hypothetical protein